MTRRITALDPDAHEAAPVSSTLGGQMTTPSSPSAARLVGVAWVAIVWGWSLFYVERFDKGTGHETMIVLYSLPCFFLLLVYLVPWPRTDSDIADALGYGTLLLSTFLLYQVSSSHGDAAGYMHFFELVALWGGALITAVVALICRPRSS